MEWWQIILIIIASGLALDDIVSAITKACITKSLLKEKNSKGD